MVTIAYFVYSALQLALFVFALRIFIKQRRAVDLFLCLSAGGLVLDNAIVGSGRFIGEGPMLMSVNTVRFVLHALTTPLLAITGLAYARNALVEWTWTRKAQVTYCVIALLAICYGVYADVFALRLEPAMFAETIRYVNVGVKGPPLAAITTMTLLIFLGDNGTGKGTRSKMGDRIVTGGHKGPAVRRRDGRP